MKKIYLDTELSQQSQTHTGAELSSHVKDTQVQYCHTNVKLLLVQKYYTQIKHPQVQNLYTQDKHVLIQYWPARVKHTHSNIGEAVLYSDDSTEVVKYEDPLILENKLRTQATRSTQWIRDNIMLLILNYAENL